MKKYSSVVVGLIISLFLLVGICLFNFKLVAYLPSLKENSNIKLLVTWINNLLGLAFFGNVGYFTLAFLKILKEDNK
ncbi:MAG: hypothetical protein ACI35S_09090 [Anaeroplasma sp.]